MFNKYDGTGRAPRQGQLDALNWIQSNLYTNKTIALNQPTGSGKSFIFKTLLDHLPDSAGIVPSNILMDQYIATYPELNYIKGKAHYACKSHEGYTCHQSQEYFNSKCEECDVTLAKERARNGEPTIFNPISYYYFCKQNKENRSPTFLVIDEAHKLSAMMELLCEYSFSQSRYNFPDIRTPLQLITWLNHTYDKLNALQKGQEDSERRTTLETMDRIKFIVQGINEAPQDFHFGTEVRKLRTKYETYLVIKPLKPPKFIKSMILGAENIIMMSATLLPSTLWTLGIHNFAYKDFPSPIPKENRPIQYQPTPFKMNFDTEPGLVASSVQEVLDKNQGNALIHVSYSWAEKLKPYFPKALFNSSDNKEEVIERFKKEGGIFFAAGCSEGLDLPDDLCRLVIVPIILKLNPNDPVTRKRRAQITEPALEGVELMQTVVQQCGRACRHENDRSLTVILDNMFPGMVNRTRKYLPSSFVESIIWSSK